MDHPSRAVIRHAAPPDLDIILDLLRRNGLPEAGVANCIGNFRVVADTETIKAAAGYERYGPYALLRSVVVDEHDRNTGLGNVLVQEVLRELTARQVKEVYLLTTTAEAYFAKRGFTPVEREAVPAPLFASEEFSHACPSSARVMRCELKTVGAK